MVKQIFEKNHLPEDLLLLFKRFFARELGLVRDNCHGNLAKYSNECKSLINFLSIHELVPEAEELTFELYSELAVRICKTF
ncbi:hypothetical protein Trydic_g4057 [Trypoxylus dichotomus]